MKIDWRLFETIEGIAKGDTQLVQRINSQYDINKIETFEYLDETEFLILYSLNKLQIGKFCLSNFKTIISNIIKQIRQEKDELVVKHLNQNILSKLIFNMYSLYPEAVFPQVREIKLNNTKMQDACIYTIYKFKDDKKFKEVSQLANYPLAKNQIPKSKLYKALHEAGAHFSKDKQLTLDIHNMRTRISNYKSNESVITKCIMKMISMTVDKKLFNVPKIEQNNDFCMPRITSPAKDDSCFTVPDEFEIGEAKMRNQCMSDQSKVEEFLSNMHQQSAEPQSFIWEITDLINYEFSYKDFNEIIKIQDKINKLMEKDVQFKMNDAGNIIDVKDSEPSRKENWVCLKLVSIKNSYQSLMPELLNYDLEADFDKESQEKMVQKRFINFGIKIKTEFWEEIVSLKLMHSVYSQIDEYEDFVCKWNDQMKNNDVEKHFDKTEEMKEKFNNEEFDERFNSLYNELELYNRPLYTLDLLVKSNDKQQISHSLIHLQQLYKMDNIDDFCKYIDYFLDKQEEIIKSDNNSIEFVEKDILINSDLHQIQAQIKYKQKNQTDSIKEVQEAIELIEKYKLERKNKIKFLDLLKFKCKVLKDSGKVEMSINELEKCMDYQKEFELIETPQYSMCLQTLGENQLKQRLQSSSLDLQLESKVIIEKQQGSHSIIQFDTLKIISNLYQLNKNYDEAYKVAEECINLQQILQGKNSISLAQMTYRIGSIHESKKEQKQSITKYLLCLEQIEKSIGKKHELQADTLNMLGNIQSKLNNYRKAIEVVNLSLFIYEQIDACGSAGQAKSLTDIASLLEENGDQGEALGQQNKSLIAWESARGVISREQIDNIISIAMILMDKGEKEEADQMLFKSKMLENLLKTNLG